MDDDNIGGGILIASEEEMEALLGNLPGEAFDIPMIPGKNIMTGCYGLFLVALDQCTDPTDKATLDEALEIDSLDECLVSCALTMYYPKVNIDYAGILTLADVMIFLSDEFPSKKVEELSESTMVNIDEQIADMLAITQEEAAASLFEALGFKPVEVDHDGPKQLELTFGHPGASN
jgi:hypothetical protein